MRGTTRLIIAAGVAGAGLSALAQPGTTPGGAPGTRPETNRPQGPAAPAGVQPDAQAETPEIETADDLLEALETADADLRTLTTEIRWAQTFALAGDMQLRTGRLIYRVAEPEGEGLPPRRAFAVEFSQKQVGDRRPAPERIDYVFDGEWFLERIHADHQAFKRQVVPPGQVADPLRIGEGPFPIPVGQRREEILARFEAELVDPVEDIDDRLRSFVEEGAGTWSLYLTPHEHLVEDSTWRGIRIWYDKSTLQPRLAWTINAAEDESYVQLINVKRDVRVDESVFNTEPPREEGWEIYITPWREDGGG